MRNAGYEPCISYFRFEEIKFEAPIGRLLCFHKFKVNNSWASLFQLLWIDVANIAILFDIRSLFVYFFRLFMI